MPLLNGNLDAIIMSERKNIQKYIEGQMYLDIELEKPDIKVIDDMEDEKIWLKRPQSKKILA